MNTMTKYKWDAKFYNEIIKDHNHRFPKFSYIQYPLYPKEGNK